MRPLDPIKEVRIIKAVFAITGKQGLAGINIAGISKQSGVGTGSIYTYFENKEELIQAAFASVEHQMTQKMYEGFDLERPVRASLHLIYRNMLEYRLRHYDESIFIDQYIQSKYLRLNFARQLKKFEQENKPLYDLLKKGQAEGVLARREPFLAISHLNGSVRAFSTGIVQQFIPYDEGTIDDLFTMVWNGIAT